MHKQNSVLFLWQTRFSTEVLFAERPAPAEEFCDEVLVKQNETIASIDFFRIRAFT